MNSVQQVKSEELSSTVEQLIGQINKVLLGKDNTVRLAITCLLAQGHLLIEDLPGMGKTTLAHALAKVLGLKYNRVQFTSDLLPTDLLGLSIFDQHTSSFSFHPGPIFTQLLLADEVNRSSPKTQSALLEAMEEKQVSIEGATRQLPAPFFVIATQNPADQAGTFPLPESQLDRFLMRITIGYPTHEAERQLLQGVDSRVVIEKMPAFLYPEQLEKLQQAVLQITVSEAVLDYLQRLIQASRQHEDIVSGVSPRGSLQLLRASQSWALMNGRSYLIPDDIQAVFVAVVAHRLSGTNGQKHSQSIARQLLDQVDVLH